MHCMTWSLLFLIYPKIIFFRKPIRSLGDKIREQTSIVTICWQSKLYCKCNHDWANCDLRINAKVGGVCSRLDNKATAWLQKVPTMIVGVYFDPFPMLVLCSKYCQGADVTHPGPGIQRPSVAGIVSSVDMHACQYTATCSVQPPPNWVDHRLEVHDEGTGFFADSEISIWFPFYFVRGHSLTLMNIGLNKEGQMFGHIKSCFIEMVSLRAKWSKFLKRNCLKSMVQIYLDQNSSITDFCLRCSPWAAQGEAVEVQSTKDYFCCGW